MAMDEDRSGRPPAAFRAGRFWPGRRSASAASAGRGRPRPDRRRALPADFLWGTAISAYQSEGNNINSDAWVSENVTPTLFREPSGDACDSYHRYAEDIAIAARLGFNCYRLGIEWARIEPSEGAFSNAELDHYARVLETCRAHGLKPVVTFNHFTTPIWFAARGGFEVPDSPDLFARYCRRAAEHLGGLMHLATTFNEANIQLLLQVMPGMSAALPAAQGDDRGLRQGDRIAAFLPPGLCRSGGGDASDAGGAPQGL